MPCIWGMYEPDCFLIMEIGLLLSENELTNTILSENLV